MNSISKSKLKAKMLETFRQLEASGEELIVTDQGKPVLKIIPSRKRPAVLKFSETFKGK
jgi:antitoxin (DNA-binding transcriptional repressor) of toxin-antitoxin stability system